jgi:tetratricopeptide (TPR) repeat protein
LSTAANPESLLQLALQDLQNNDLAAAEAKCVRALDADREHSGAWTVLGMVLQARGRYDDAIRVFNSLTLKAPGEAAHWENLGVVLRTAKRYDEALAAYQRAIVLAPRSAMLLYGIGLVHMERFDYDSAYNILSQASEMAPNDAWIRYGFAQCCYNFGNFEEASAILENWPSFEGLTPANMAEIAYLLVNMGETRQAQSAIDYLSAHAPANGRAVLTLVNVYERTNRLGEARATMARLKADRGISGFDPDVLLAEAALAQRDNRDEETHRLLSLALSDHSDFVRRHHLLFPLAKSLDSLRNYEGAFATLSEAHRSQVAYLGAALDKTTAQESPTMALTRHGVDAGDVAGWHDTDAPSRVDSPIFVVGFPRSGTTLLELTLDAHPSLASMDEQLFLKRASDQLKSFGIEHPEDFGNLDALQLNAARAEYWLRVVKKVQLAPGQRLVDKNPFNMLRLPLIRRLFPNAQTILIVRHPCDVLVSCFFQHFRAPDLAMLCRDLPTLADSYRRAFDYWYQQLPLLGASTYELRYENFVADFAGQARSLTDFLGLPWDAAMLAHAEHARARGFISTPSYSQVVQPVSGKAIGRWKNYQRQLQDVMPVLEPYLCRWGYST